MQASELYGILESLAAQQPSAEGLRQLHEVLALALAQGSSHAGGTFGNLFAQTDFVCRHLGMSNAQRRALQAARRATGSREVPTAADWRYHLRAVSLLVSAVFAENEPPTLTGMLPRNLRPQEAGLRINMRYVRCMVRSFSETTIVADTTDGEIHVDYANTAEGRNFAYLRKMLRQGMQLNLLDCHVEGDAVVPGLVVVEPDFLIDISSLAACFTAYGHHPLLYTLNRLKPRPNSQATLLGNFAGTALDELISDPQATLRQVFQRSFEEQPLRYMACPDFSNDRFMAEAAQQMDNIRQTVEALTQEGFDLNHSLLEPSFVCEKLGLQGRVDMMMDNMTLLVEQKSGKNMKIEHQSHDVHGLQLESHYVQLLLYYGLLRYNFGKTDAQVDTRLLYSRYEPARGLVAVNYYVTLFREAMCLRNQIVATELLIARDGFGRVLPLLTADIIYKGVARDGFFQRYVLPAMESLTTLTASMSELEKAYYCRMMTFVYREQRARKLGTSEQTLYHSGGCASDLWLMPLAEKQEQGTIVAGLRMVDRQKGAHGGGYNTITLSRAAGGNGEAPNFRRGDMVCVYRYSDVPDVRHSILYKGTLQTIAPDRLVVVLNNGQQHADVFTRDPDGLWAMEHGDSDASTGSSIRSLQQLMEASQERRDLLLGQRAPRCDTSRRLHRHYHPHYDDLLLKAAQAQDYFLLVGPPGTGKTSMALRFMVEEELASLRASGRAGERLILLMAYTNRAVDEICAMLCAAGTDFFRLGNAAACDERFRDYLDPGRLQSVSVVVSTTSMLLAQPFVLSLKHFALAIVDEASQILEPGLVGLLSHGSIDRFVLVGDHKQLPAVVQQSAADAGVSEPCLQAIGLTDCRQSLFQRLYSWEVGKGRTRFVGTLIHQGRMHPAVAAFASTHFYGGMLEPVPLSHQLEPALPYTMPSLDALDDVLKQHRTAFFPVVPKGPTAGSGKSNADEALLVARLSVRIARFYGERFDPARTLGIIVPYRNQIAAIRQALSGQGFTYSDQVTIDTVERYQGSQRDVIIYSFTIGRLYQLDFLTAGTFADPDSGQTVDRKLNVALTRSRVQMLMVGNPVLLRHNPIFRQLIDDNWQSPL